MSSLTELREKVERASGPDRELDAAIWALTEGWALTYTESNVILADKPGEVQRVIGWIDPGERSRNARINRDDIPAVTASIDAALALVERGAPHLEFVAVLLNTAVTRAWDMQLATAAAHLSDVLPRAVLIEYLRALESQEQAGG